MNKIDTNLVVGGLILLVLAGWLAFLMPSIDVTIRMGGGVLIAVIAVVLIVSGLNVLPSKTPAGKAPVKRKIVKKKPKKRAKKR